MEIDANVVRTASAQLQLRVKSVSALLLAAPSRIAIVGAPLEPRVLVPKLLMSVVAVKAVPASARITPVVSVSARAAAKKESHANARDRFLAVKTTSLTVL